MVTIGVDFGNMYSFPAFILDMNTQTRKGGIPIDLLPSSSQYTAGIPTVYYYGSQRGELYGLQALQARPIENRRMLLKRKFWENERIAGKNVAYDEVVTRMIEHVVRIANEELWKNYHETSNNVSFAYPVDFDHAYVQHFVELAEKGTLIDGTKIHVVGTIKEPAAAALAYLSGDANLNINDCNVLVYDLGGGTFDLASVTAHVNGLQRNGAVSYYDIMGEDGEQLGGHEFDEAMINLLKKKTGTSPQNPHAEEQWRIEAEAAKIALSSSLEYWGELPTAGGDTDSIRVTRAEYEDEIRPLVARTVERTRAMLENPNLPNPELILLTGGQSQTPLIRTMLEAAFPQYRNRIRDYKPQRAIAYGAARYGVLVPPDPDPIQPINPAVVKRNRFDLGIGNILDIHDRSHVDTLVLAGTKLPTDTQNAWHTYRLHTARQVDTSEIYEAILLNPDRYQQSSDYKRIMRVQYDFGRTVPKGTQIDVCMYVDKNDMVHVIVRDPINPEKMIEGKITLTADDFM